MKNRPSVLIFILVLFAAVAVSAWSLGREYLPDPEEICQQDAKESAVALEMAEEYAKSELTMVVKNGTELLELEKYENLLSLDLSGSTCYEEIEEYIDGHPQVAVTYSVTVSGDGEPLTLDSKVTEVIVKNRSYLSDLSAKAMYLHFLKTVILREAPKTLDELGVLREACGSAEVLFDIGVGTEIVSPDSTELDLSALTGDQVIKAAEFLTLMTGLERVTLTGDDGENLLSLSDLAPLEQSAPEAKLDYRFLFFGVPVSTESESLEFYGNTTGYLYDDGLDHLEEMLPFLPRLKELYFEFCEIEYDSLAAFRERHPEIKVAWRINFGPYSCRTDVERIYADGSLTNEMCENLKYCTAVKYIDLGHNPGLTEVWFTAYMPELEVAIFAAGGLRDVSPLASCKKLRYLEIFTTSVRDLSPLAECTALEHLNVSCLPVRDISPLYELTNLKRFWCTLSYVPIAQRNEIRDLMPECSFCFENVEPTGGGWRFNSDGSRSEPYEELCEIFNYDNWRESITYW